MNENNTTKTNKAPEIAGGGGCPVLKGDVILSTTGKAGGDHADTHIEGMATDVLLALTSAVHAVIRCLADSGVDTFTAAMSATEAVENGISIAIRQIASAHTTDK